MAKQALPPRSSSLTSGCSFGSWTRASLRRWRD